MAQLTFRKSIKIAPGVRVNVTHRGVRSVSAGAGGLRLTQQVGGRGSSRRTPAPPRPTSAERRAAQAEKLAAIEARLGPVEFARRRVLNTMLLAWVLTSFMLLVSVVMPPAVIFLIPSVWWAVVATRKYRRHMASTRAQV